MRFVKMHGLGNDYVYVDCFRQKPPKDPAALAIRVSRPHFGIGSDGLILILPEPGVDARMRMFNADGSEGAMCGNGIRCVAKYLYDSGLCRKETLRVATGAGIREIQLRVEHGLATGARVDMGAPVFEAERIPVLAEGDSPADLPLEAAGRSFRAFCLSTGTAHAVLFGKAPDEATFAEAGPALEKHRRFPQRANIEFCEVLDRHSLNMRVWERGSGETLACGTGATASAVAAIRAGLCDSPVAVALKGGQLTIEWEGGESHAFMTGAADLVFTGEWLDD